jgi:hypothetical protein
MAKSVVLWIRVPAQTPMARVPSKYRTTKATSV